MADEVLEELICGLRGALLGQGGAATDRQLLDSFLDRRDGAAFAALVRRHGPMVLGVCRRVLANGHDAEDAFQAVFLVLVRKAGSLRGQTTLGNWLYGVAYRTALKARASAWKRQARERQVTDMPAPTTTEEVWLDVRPVLDEELSRLPDRYREAIVLCDVEGRTRREAARQLGVPEGTLSGRLTTARRLLAGRLTRRGVTLSVGALAAVLPQAAEGGIPASLVCSTVTAATGASAPAHVAALTEGVLRSMLLTKVTRCALVVLTAAAVAAGAGFLGRGGPAAPEVHAAPAPRAPAPERPKPDEPPKLFSPQWVLDPAVQAELKVTDEQRKQIDAVLAKVRAAYKDDLAKDGQAGPDEAKMGQLRYLVAEQDALTKALPGILTAPQLKRLVQIGWQLRGLHDAFFDPDVQKKLALTKQQQAEVEKILDDLRGQARALYPPTQPVTPAAVEATLPKFLPGAVGRFVDVLTKEQKAVWKDVTGEPFQLPPPPPGPPKFFQK
jgi:RNA polymerase sigma factor (sigma-70 family)